MSRTTVLYDGPHYHAAWIDGPHGGLCVTRVRKQSGIYLTGEHAQEWRDAFITALDNIERSALCRAILEA